MLYISFIQYSFIPFLIQYVILNLHFFTYQFYDIIITINLLPVKNGKDGVYKRKKAQKFKYTSITNIIK